MTDKKQDEKSFDSSKINTQELQKYKQDYSVHRDLYDLDNTGLHQV